MKRSLTVIGLLFVVLVVVPAWLSWGPGLEATWGSARVQLHTVKNPIGFFFLLLAALYVAWPAFQAGCLKALEAYESLDASRQRHWEVSLLVAAACWLAFLKWTQFRGLDTGVVDHGVFINLFWNVTHGNGLWSSVLDRHFLAEHFAPMLYVLALPFHLGAWAFWPLLAQTWAMVAAVAVAMRLGKETHPVRPVERLGLGVLFLMNPYFHSIHQCDMHPIAFGILPVMLLYLWAKQSRWGLFYLLLPVALFTIQEDVSLMCLGLGLVLCLNHATRKHGIIVVVVSALAFSVNVEWLIKVFAETPTAFMARYQTMGGDMKHIVTTLVLKPGVPLQLLVNPRHASALAAVFFSFGFLPFAMPAYLLGLLPAILQHSLADYEPQFLYGFHYSSNVLPLLMTATVACVSARKFPVRWSLPVVFILLSYAGFKGSEYSTPKSPRLIARAWDVARGLGPELKVSVQNSVGAPYCFRRDVYVYPRVDDADVIVLCPGKNVRPISRAEYDQRFSELSNDPRWTGEFQDELWIFRKKSAPKV